MMYLISDFIYQKAFVLTILKEIDNNQYFCFKRKKYLIKDPFKIK
jgi:hypothetical protein